MGLGSVPLGGASRATGTSGPGAEAPRTSVYARVGAILELGHGQPAGIKLGHICCRGNSVASNIDPYATTPPAGRKWLTDGPHMRIFNTKVLLDAYPHAVTETRTQLSPTSRLRARPTHT